MISDNVEGLRQARSEVGNSLRIASMDYKNSRAVANGNGKRLTNDVDRNGIVRQKVKFSADMNQKLQQILVGGINQ